MRRLDLVAGAYIFTEDKLLLVLHKKLGLWLPVGGHKEENEDFDECIKREAKEETNLEIKLINHAHVPVEGNVVKNLATPFYVNIHSVGDHDHHCFFYLCEALNPDEIKINKKELRDYKWISRKNLNEDLVPVDVRNIGKLAFYLRDF